MCHHNPAEKRTAGNQGRDSHQVEIEKTVPTDLLRAALLHPFGPFFLEIVVMGFTSK
jgi:hypothetical protein